MITNQSLRLRKILISAVLLSIALVMKTYLTFYIPLFGENGMRIGLSGVFTALPAILFGPLFGAAVCGLSDILGYLLKPTGAFMPLITLAAILNGFMQGLIWNLLRKGIGKKLRIGVLIFVILVAAFGVYNMVVISADGLNASFYENNQTPVDTSEMHMISRLLVERTQNDKNPAAALTTYTIYLTTALIGLALLGLVLIAADLIMSKRLMKNGYEPGIMAILIALIVSGMVQTTLVTVILREMLFPSWKLMPFIAVWLPRIVLSVVETTITAYFVALLYSVFLRQGSLQKIIRKTAGA